MRPVNSLARFRRLTGADRLALAEALVTLALASAAIRLLPFRTVVRFLASDRLGREAGRASTENAMDRARWAVQALARRVPWRTVCFQKGLALHIMLRRRGIPSVLHYGVRTDPEKGVTAHVWVTESGRAVIGGEEAPAFTCLATYPEALR